MSITAYDFIAKHLDTINNSNLDDDVKSELIELLEDTAESDIAAIDKCIADFIYDTLVFRYDLKKQSLYEVARIVDRANSLQISMSVISEMQNEYTNDKLDHIYSWVSKLLREEFVNIPETRPEYYTLENMSDPAWAHGYMTDYAVDTGVLYKLPRL